MSILKTSQVIFVAAALLSSTQAAYSDEFVSVEHLNIKAECPDGPGRSGKFSLTHQLDGVGRFAVGGLINRELSDDISVSANVNGTDTEKKTGTSAFLSIGDWKVNFQIRPGQFPSREPEPVGETMVSDSKFVDSLYAPINTIMPPVFIELVGETTNCVAPLPHFSITLWRSQFAIIKLDSSPAVTPEPKPSSSETLLFLKGYYSKDYDRIFSVPSAFAAGDFRDWFAKLYNNPHVYDAIDERGVIDLAKLGVLCVNKDGSLLIYKVDGETLLSLSLNSAGELVPYRAEVFTNIPDSLDRVGHEAESIEERRLIEFGDYEAHYFGMDAGWSMGIGNPYALHREEIWHYIARGKKRIASRLECSD